MKKLPVCCALACILLAGCGDIGLRDILVNTVASSSGGGNNTVTTAQASKAGQAVVDGVTMVMNNLLMWDQTNLPNVSYSATGVSMTGTLSIIGVMDTFNLTITFSGYVDSATGYTLTGTVNFSQVVDTSTSAMSGTATGSLTSSGGPVTTQTWNVSFSGTTSIYAFTGRITCNGIAFDASTLSL